jgi:Ca-activated chloride channel family protein
VIKRYSNAINSIKYDNVLQDGTELVWISNCSKQIKDSQAKSKVVILLTDGVNNAILSQTASIATTIKVYTVELVLMQHKPPLLRQMENFCSK